MQHPLCRSVLQQWQVHFGQRLTDIHIVQGNLQDAQQSLDQAQQAAVQIKDISMQVFQNLSHKYSSAENLRAAWCMQSV